MAVDKENVATLAPNQTPCQTPVKSLSKEMPEEERRMVAKASQLGTIFKYECAPLAARFFTRPLLFTIVFTIVFVGVFSILVFIVAVASLLSNNAAAGILAKLQQALQQKPSVKLAAQAFHNVAVVLYNTPKYKDAASMFNNAR